MPEGIVGSFVPSGNRRLIRIKVPHAFTAGSPLAHSFGCACCFDIVKREDPFERPSSGPVSLTAHIRMDLEEAGL
jgi:hypothetical protein